MKARKLFTVAMVLLAISIILYPVSSAPAEPPIVYLKSDDLIRGPKGIVNIVKRVIPGATVHAMFWDKKIADLGDPTPEELERARGDPNMLITRGMPDTGSLAGIWMNARLSPTKFVAFRKAIGHLVDWEYLRTSFWGSPAILYPVLYSAGGPTEWINETCTFPEYSRDLALKVLQDGGFKKDATGKWIDPEGNPVPELIVVCPSYSPDRMEFVRLLEKELDALGFTYRNEFHGWAECEKMTYLDKNYHIFMNYADFNAFNMPTSYWNLFHSKSYAPPGTLSQNYQGIQDPVLDRYIEAFAAAKTWEEAAIQCKNIQGRIWQMAYTYMWRNRGGSFSIHRLDMYTNPYTKRDILGMYVGYLNVIPVEPQYQTMLVDGDSDWFISANLLQWTEALYEHNYFMYVYQPLFYEQGGPDVPSGFVAQLAYAYQLYEEGDGYRIRFYLFPNATWHDGVPFTAEDVKFTFDFFCKEQKNANKLYAALKSIYVKSQVVNKTVVDVWTNQKSVWTLKAFTLAWIIPKHIWGNLTDPASFKNWPPIGTGPMMVKEYVPREYILYTKWDKYHLRWLSPEERASQEVQERQKTLEARITGLTQQITSLQNEINNLRSANTNLSNKITSLESSVSSMSSMVYGALGVGVLGVIIALVAIFVGRRKT
ncbi:MAG: ABC transporter substrate-binding protein [Thaumarchaeota archaeon]|jgi:ABC-type transport system substrate-binding protein|nr:ABC transporter substrate-binding protein [Candidatus Terraquivivens yellowstonensis]